VTCTKTGAHILLEEYGLYAYGDAFETTGGQAIFRIVQTENRPIFARLHYTVHEIEEWFDRHAKVGETSTLIAKLDGFRNEGYEGVRIA
jgi:hypothetical protein